MNAGASEDLWRAELPHVLAALLRRSTDRAACEDAVQEALFAAARQWPNEGVPDKPRGWLIRVASRRLIDRQRSDEARTKREQRVASDRLADERTRAATEGAAPLADDTLQMLFLCAHPALSPTSQVALTLRVVAGLTTAQIAAALLVPEATMAQRIGRARSTIADCGPRLLHPARNDLPARISAVHSVLYLVFNEGYTASCGPSLIDFDLTYEAIRLAETLHRKLPSNTETAGLLALMLLTHARAPARTDVAGDIIPLDEQDRTQWNQQLIDQGTRLIEQALPAGRVGPFQLQAAIAAVHAEATTADATDWPQIVELYRMLNTIRPSNVVTLNLAAAIGMAESAEAGLATLSPLLDDPAEQGNHRVHSAHAHLLELAGDAPAAAVAFRRAATLTNSIPEQRYLHDRGEHVICRAANRDGKVSW